MITAPAYLRIPIHPIACHLQADEMSNEDHAANIKTNTYNLDSAHNMSLIPDLISCRKFQPALRNFDVFT